MFCEDATRDTSGSSTREPSQNGNCGQDVVSLIRSRGPTHATTKFDAPPPPPTFTVYFCLGHRFQLRELVAQIQYSAHTHPRAAPLSGPGPDPDSVFPRGLVISVQLNGRFNVRCVRSATNYVQITVRGRVANSVGLKGYEDQPPPPPETKSLTDFQTHGHVHVSPSTGPQAG